MKRTLLTLSALTALGLTAVIADDRQNAPDNSAKNERDRSGETLTSGDQSNRPEDLKITQNIRRAVMKDDGLSMTAKNVKIITANGKVTLRGPVKTAKEKSRIAELATSAAGGAQIDNQLEVKASK